ncbi:sugar transferase [Patescibacteria group bacterium]
MIYEIGKRLIDIVGALVGIILFSPLIIIGLVWVKIVSPKGPMLADIPDRVGKKGKEFRMYKIRSMIPNGQRWLEDHPEWKKKYIENNYKLDPDPRWIKGAKILRKTSIDEMPQFLNILKGEMSVVGPRAYFPFELVEQGEKYPQTKKFIDAVLTTKPGLTGPWQVGGRSDIGFEERIKMDAEYAKKRSLMYDITIILKTPLAVLSQRGSM